MLKCSREQAARFINDAQVGVPAHGDGRETAI
jgi:hypothetical protein